MKNEKTSFLRLAFFLFVQNVIGEASDQCPGTYADCHKPISSHFRLQFLVLAL